MHYSKFVRHSLNVVFKEFVVSNLITLPLIETLFLPRREIQCVCCIYCQTQKTVNTWQISGMLIVYWPTTIKFSTHEQTSKPQTNYHCCCGYHLPYWLISYKTITFHKYFWCSQFCEFHSNFLSQVIFVFLLFLGMVIYANEVETKEKEKLPKIKN